MSFSFLFHSTRTDAGKRDPYLILHKDYSIERTATGEPYTSVTISSDDGDVTLFLPYGGRLDISVPGEEGKQEPPEMTDGRRLANR